MTEHARAVHVKIVPTVVEADPQRILVLVGAVGEAAVDIQGCRLLVSYGSAGDPAAPEHALPQQPLHGPTLPSPNHSDAVLDLKTIDLPIKMMLSSSRDGIVKCWR